MISPSILYKNQVKIRGCVVVKILKYRHWVVKYMFQQTASSLASKIALPNVKIDGREPAASIAALLTLLYVMCVL